MGRSGAKARLLAEQALLALACPLPPAVSASWQLPGPSIVFILCREILPQVLKVARFGAPCSGSPLGHPIPLVRKRFSLRRRALQESLLASGGNHPPLRGSSTFDQELQLAMALSLQEQQEQEQRRQEEEEEELKEALQRSLLEK